LLTALHDAYRYDPFGVNLDTQGTTTNPYRFQGRLLESTSGQYDFGARQYDPAIAAFTSFDSVMGSAHDPISLNRYVYVHANPEAMIDPDGHWAEQFDSRQDRQSAVFGVSMGDVVRASHRKGQLEFSRVEKRGGHSTYRLMVSPEAIGPTFESRWDRLSEIGCGLERASARFVAVDVPPRTDIYAAYDLIEDGQLAGVWLFEEGHCGHSVRSARDS